MGLRVGDAAGSDSTEINVTVLLSFGLDKFTNFCVAVAEDFGL